MLFVPMRRIALLTLGNIFAEAFFFFLIFKLEWKCAFSSHGYLLPDGSVVHFKITSPVHGMNLKKKIARGAHSHPVNPV